MCCYSTYIPCHLSAIIVPCNKMTLQDLRGPLYYRYVHCGISPSPQMPKGEKNNCSHPPLPSKIKQSITRNLENRDKDSKLPVEEDAGIHSTSFADGRTGLPILRFPLCRPLSSVSMQSHGLDQEKNTTCSTSQSFSQDPGEGWGGAVNVTLTPPSHLFKYEMRVT